MRLPSQHLVRMSSCFWKGIHQLTAAAYDSYLFRAHLSTDKITASCQDLEMVLLKQREYTGKKDKHPMTRFVSPLQGTGRILRKVGSCRYGRQLVELRRGRRCTYELDHDGVRVSPRRVRKFNFSLRSQRMSGSGPRSYTLRVKISLCGTDSVVLGSRHITSSCYLKL